ncbi:MAG TPA: transposase [Firmicutes bacterium]|nr:transposase [Bacillota bacterium]
MELDCPLNAARDYRSGISKARQEGRQEGLREERVRLVRKMLAEGLDESSIKNIADLTQAELEAIKNV